MVNRPHGGRLINRTLSQKATDRVIEELGEYGRMDIKEVNAVDIGSIADGTYSPLTGFMTSDELGSVLSNMRLPDDVPWTIPVVLDIDRELLDFDEGDTIILHYNGVPLARMHVDDIYSFDRMEYARSVFGTMDKAHPGVKRVMELQDTLVGGEVEMMGELPNPYKEYTLSPRETRILFKERGWKTIVAFQTRNVSHVGHEFLQKTAATFVDGLFINPVIGKKKAGDFRDDVILRTYDELIKNYYPKAMTHMSILRYEMKYAGPKEAIHHAIMRKNFGCTHIIIGRDHAGVGNYYGPFDAQEIFKEFPDLGMEPMAFQA
ncbi:MAG: sulfate adenylyltransferase, partial [Candidatus Thermoplasmatota archaeon]|nr:sulfate adenylyltransferase [Candidatus Thermoplasmatota archaeon]